MCKENDTADTSHFHLHIFVHWIDWFCPVSVEFSWGSVDIGVCFCFTPRRGLIGHFWATFRHFLGFGHQMEIRTDKNGGFSAAYYSIPIRFFFDNSSSGHFWNVLTILAHFQLFKSSLAMFGTFWAVLGCCHIWVNFLPFFFGKSHILLIFIFTYFNAYFRGQFSTCPPPPLASSVEEMRHCPPPLWPLGFVGGGFFFPFKA